MFLLPKGNPLFENLAVSKLKLPEILSKLANGSFTGYASFVFQNSTVILVFEAGKLISALLEGVVGARRTGFEAISSLAELMVSSGSGALNVYKLSKDLTMSIHALLEGETLYKAQDLKLVDIKVLLEKIRNDRMNGCLRIYTDQRSAMIFYKEGKPLGFFHDGSSDIETSSSESQKIASLPGAKIDLYSTQSFEELMDINLLEVANIQSIWDNCLNRHQSGLESVRKERLEREIKSATLKLAELEEQIRVIVGEYVGRVGRGIVDKALSDNGGNPCLLHDQGAVQFMSGIERAAKLLISSTNIRLMMEKLSAVITTAKANF